MEKLDKVRKGEAPLTPELAGEALDTIMLLKGLADGLREQPKMREKVCRMALEAWGADAQTTMVFEEMAELQKALCKLERQQGSVSDVAEEIADVQIMLAQMILLHDCRDEVERWKSRKLRRLEQRLRGLRSVCDGNAAACMGQQRE